MANNRPEKLEAPTGRVYNPREVRTLHKDLAQAVGGGVLPEELPGVPRPEPQATEPMPSGEKLTPEERLAFAEARLPAPDAAGYGGQAAGRGPSLPRTPTEKPPQYRPDEEEDILFLGQDKEKIPPKMAVPEKPSPQPTIPAAAPSPHREPPASLPIARPPAPPSAPVPPTPPPSPTAPKPGGARIPNIPLLAGLVVISLLLVAGGYWFFFARSPAGAPPPQAAEEPETIEPPSSQEQPSLQPLIPGARVLVLEAENLGDLTALFRQTLQGSHPLGFMVMDMRIKTASGSGAPLGTLDQTFAVTGMRLPNELMALMRRDQLNVFIRSSPDGNRPGIIIGMTGSYALEAILTGWTQTTIRQDLEGLVAPLGGIFPQQVSFSINTHKNHCIFYQNLPDPGVTIDVFVIPAEVPLFALATSRQSAWDLIDSFGIVIPQVPESCG